MKKVSNFWNKYSGQGILLIMPQTRDENTLRGRPFDYEGGGGWHFWSGKIIYFLPVLGRKIYLRVNRGQNIYFQPQQFFEKAKKKKKKKKNRGGGVGARV